MKGFISVLATKTDDIYQDVYGNWKRKEAGCAHSAATFFDKFRVDKKNDVYVRDGLGAIVANVDVPIKTIEDLEKCRDKKTGKNPYQHILDMRSKGYVLVVGKAFPKQHGGVDKNQRGVYCSNYLEMAKREKEEEIRRQELIDNYFKDQHTL